MLNSNCGMKYLKLIYNMEVSMSKHFIKGLVTEVITPFKSNGDIDYKMMGELIDFQVKSGVTNFFVNGLGAECHHCSMEEKLKLLKVTRDSCTPECKIMACSFEPSLQENKKLLDLYMKSGLCDCYCITAPPFFSHTPEALYDWASQLIDYCDKPVYIYDCIQMGMLFDADILCRLRENHPNLKGYKDATKDIVHLLQILAKIDKNDFDFLGGCDGEDGVHMLLGAVGCVSFMAVTFPKEMKEIVDYGLAGDYEKCMQAQYKVLKLRNVMKKSPFNAAYMYGQKYTGSPIVLHSRMPADQSYVTKEVREELDKVIKELGIEDNYQ